MKRIIYIIIILGSFISTAKCQSKLFGHGFYDIQSYKFGWIGTDTVGYFDSLRLDMRKPIWLNRWNTAGRPSSPQAGYIGFNTDSTGTAGGGLEWYSGSDWIQASGSGGGGGGGVTGVGTFDSETPSSDGAVISGSNIVFQSASGTNPGMINTSTQTFAGVKTFSSTPIVPNNGISILDGDGSNTLTIVNGKSLAFDRTLTIAGSDANQTLTLNGNVSFAAAFRHLGAFGLDLTVTAATNATFPTGSITLVSTAASQTLTNKTITSSTNVLGGVTMTLGSDADGDIYYRSSNALTRLGVGTAGQVLQVNSGATAPEWGSIVTSDTYSPTYTTSTNTTAGNTVSGTYTRIGNVVHVGIFTGITCTSSAATSEIEISLPVASNFSNEGSIAGSGVDRSNGTTPCVVYSNFTDDRAVIRFTSYQTGVNSFSINFSYYVQ